MILGTPTNPKLTCSLLTSPYRVQCSAGYEDGTANWSGTVSVDCLLNDYGTAYSRNLSVNVTNVTNVTRSPTIAAIGGQNVLAGQAIATVDANGTSVDSEPLTYSCQYDNLADGNVAGGAASCTSLLNQGGGNATFNATTGVFDWTPRLLDGGQSFEFRITTTGSPSNLTASALFVINVGYPPPSPATSTVAVSSGTVSSGSGVTITLQAKDSGGNNLPVGGATVVFSHSGGSSTGSFSAVTDNGNGTYTATFTGAVSGTATTISATINGSTVTTALPTVTVNPGPISATKSTIAVSSGTVASGSNVTLTLQARDAADNLVTTGGAAVVFSRSGGTSTGTIGATINTLTVTTTSPTIQVTPGPVSVTSTQPSLVVVPGGPSGAHSQISVGTGTLNSGASTTLTVQARDANNNIINTGGQTVTFGTSGGTSTGTIGSVTDNTNGT